MLDDLKLKQQDSHTPMKEKEMYKEFGFYPRTGWIRSVRKDKGIFEKFCELLREKLGM